MNYFYERSQFSKFKSNTTYHQLLQMTDDEFTDWARTLRKEVTEQVMKNHWVLSKTLIKMHQ